MSNDQQSRVLCRQLARDLTKEELDSTSGGFSTKPGHDFTTTFCTAGVGGSAAFQDGDDD